MKISGKGWFSILLLLIFLFFTIDSFNYGHKARIIPLLIVSFTLVFTLIQIGKDVFLLGKTNKADSESEPSSQNPNDSETQNSDKSPWLFVVTTVIWLCGFAAILYFTSYLIAVPVFLFFYVWLVGKVKVVNAFGTAAGLVVFMFIMFELILGARF